MTITQIQLRRGTAAQWTAANPILAPGEIGLETDTEKQKVGDGVTAWSALGYRWRFNPANVAITGGTINATDVRDFTNDIRIANRSGLKAALDLAKTQRVALIGIGDSNQSFSGSGWTWHMAQAMARTYGCYGTGLVPFIAQGFTSSIGAYQCYGGGGPSPAANAGAPAALDAYAPPVGGMYSYSFLADTILAGVTSTNFALGISPAHPMDLTGSLLFRMSYGTFVAGGANVLRPTVRQDSPPYTTLVTAGANIPTVTGAAGIADHTLALAANAARTYSVVWTPLAIGSNVQGPFFGLGMSCENSDKSYGVSYSFMLGYAGNALPNFLTSLRSRGATAIVEYFRQIRLGLTGATKTAVIFINSGMNDRNIADASPSVGPNPTMPGSSAAAYTDNLNGLISLLQGHWVTAGGTAATLHICIVPSHPASYPDDAKLVSYRAAAIAVAHSTPNVSAVVIPSIRPELDFVRNLWWDNGGSAHLKDIGYSALANSIADELNTDKNVTVLQLNTAITVPLVAAAGSQDVTVTVNGAQIGNPVSLGLSAAPTAGLVYQGWVSAQDTVKIRVQNITAAGIAPPATDPIQIVVTR